MLRSIFSLGDVVFAGRSVYVITARPHDQQIEGRGKASQGAEVGETHTQTGRNMHWCMRIADVLPVPSVLS